MTNATGIFGLGAAFFALLLGLQTLRLSWAQDELGEARRELALLHENARQADAAVGALQEQVREADRRTENEQVKRAQRQEIITGSNAAQVEKTADAPVAVVDRETSSRAIGHINATLGHARH